MTRINLIKPNQLVDKHLLAEHREIKRIPNQIKKWQLKKDWIPDKFCLWKWHVKFFIDKLKFLHNRYNVIHNECLNRWFNVSDFNDAFDKVPYILYNDYYPDTDDIQLSQDRIDYKLNEKTSIR